MKKYNFNLSTVLSIRKNIEKEWEANLGRANGECQTVQNRIDLLKEQVLISKKSAVDINQFQVKCIYEDRLQFQINKELKLLKEKEIERDNVKKIYLEKSIERKIIDKLKDKSVIKYKKELLKNESLIIDEINSSSTIREKMLGGTV